MLGFFSDWLEEMAKDSRIDSLHVICFDQAETSIPNVRISRLTGGRIARVCRFFWSIWHDDADIAFVHMTPIWLIFGWPVWSLKGTKKALWFTHGVATTTLRIAVLLADTVFTATKRAFPVKSHKVMAIGHAISGAFQNVVRSPRPENRFAILAVGRAMPRKHVVETLRFFANIREQESRATLDWAGILPGEADPYRNDIEQTIEEFHLKDAVYFLGAVPPKDIPRLYANHDLLLHLSGTGSLDKVVPEALACGCPLFSTNPATEEGVGEAWYWKGPLDEHAARHAVEGMKRGVSDDERLRILQRYELHAFIGQLVDSLDTMTVQKERPLHIL